VNTSVQEIANSSSQVNLNSDELSALADKLRELVGRFKV
jgi:methyl-accepting chemotaxis protein